MERCRNVGNSGTNRSCSSNSASREDLASRGTTSCERRSAA
jgi:hypothetical protein